MTLRIRAKIADNFSPYLDPAPFADFYDNFARRGGTSLALAALLNFGIFGLLFSNVTLPKTDLKEPDIIPIQIIQIAAPKAVPEPQPVPEPVPEPEPVAVPNPPAIEEPIRSAPPPPPPPPEPTQPPPPPPEPAPQTILAPVPDILSAPQLEPIDIAPLPEPVVTIAEPRPIEIELFEPEPPINIGPAIVPDPIVEPLVEPLPQSIGQPVPQDIPAPEPIIEPIIELAPLPEPEPFQIGPAIDGLDIAQDPVTVDPLPLPPIIEPLLPEQIIEEVAPGTIGAPLPPEPVQELILPELDPLPEPEPLAEPEITPEPFQIGPSLEDSQKEDEPDFVSPPVDIVPEEEEEELDDTPPLSRDEAPLILADDDAPITNSQRERAVPQDQADTGNRPSPRAPNNDGNNGGGGTYRTPTINSGGASAGIAGSTTPPPGGVSRPAIGSTGWTLAPGTQGEPSKTGLSGIEIDIRCREAGRSHEDCPQYIRQLESRDANGFESPGTHRNSQIGGGSLINPDGLSGGRAGTSTNPAIGGGLGSSSARGGGWTSDTRGLPSTSIIDDADFGRTFRNTPLGTGNNQDSRVRDLFGGQELNLPNESFDPNAADQDQDAN